MRMWTLAGALILLAGCAKTAPTSTAVSGLSCKGIYMVTDSQGNLKKYNQYEREGQCWTDNLPLSQFEKTQQAWNKNHVTCVPQPGFASRTVIAANNYYQYRDNKALIDFNAQTGVYRRLTLGEDANGNQTYSKLQGCFYQRTGAGVDASYGKQLLLDTDVAKLATSQSVDLWEIFSYTETATDLNMVRFDDSVDWDYRFCSGVKMPWQYCTLIRNGNDMFFPILSAADQTSLLNEAILIRKQFNYVTTTTGSFNNLWNNADATRKEKVQEDLLYDVIQNVDTPRYVDQAWKSYVMGSRPTMPDITSSRVPPICYSGSKSVTLADGSTGKVYGQICYVNGAYTFTQN